MFDSGRVSRWFLLEPVLIPVIVLASAMWRAEPKERRKSLYLDKSLGTRLEASSAHPSHFHRLNTWAGFIAVMMSAGWKSHVKMLDRNNAVR